MPPELQNNPRTAPSIPPPLPVAPVVQLSRRRTLSAFELLPDAALSQIFCQTLLAEFGSASVPLSLPEEEVEDEETTDGGISILYLSRALLPSAIAATYSSIWIRDPRQSEKLFAALKHRPLLSRFVRSCSITASPEDQDSIGNGGRQLVAEESFALPKSEKRRLRREDLFSGILPPIESPYDPSRFTFCDDFLQKLLDFLPNLKDLAIYGKALISTILAPRPRPRPYFASLKSIILIPRIPNFLAAELQHLPATILVEYEMDYDKEEDRDICAKLALIPSLEIVEFMGNRQFMPCATSSQPSSIALAPRSWGIKRLLFRDMNLINDLSSVFTSLTENLTVLVLEAKAFSTTLRSDLLLVPTSLVHLQIISGSPVCNLGHYPPPLYPTIDDALLRFVKLESLDLSGPVVSVSFWNQVHRLSKLKHLSTGYHLPLDGTAIISLIEEGGGPPHQRLKELCSLGLNVCHCSAFQGKRSKWSEGLTYTEGVIISRALKREGIQQSGNLACQVRECDNKCDCRKVTLMRKKAIQVGKQNF